MRLAIVPGLLFVLAIYTHPISAWRTPELVEALEATEALELSAAHSGIKEASSDPKIFTLIKYTVVPSKAAAFIEEMKAAKEGAKASDGFVAYDVIKTVDDNLTFYVWNVWETNEDRRSYWRSETARKLLDFIAKEDIETELSAARPVA